MKLPSWLQAIEADTLRTGFELSCSRETGALLRTLAASKPGGRILELGTGTGVSACWLLDGMDSHAKLWTVDSDQAVLELARRHLGDDQRIVMEHGDAGSYLASIQGSEFDLIFADAWPGKFTHLHEALALLPVGGIYVIDDLLPQPSWPDGHAPRVPKLVAELRSKNDLIVTELDWSTGILIATRGGD